MLDLPPIVNFGITLESGLKFGLATNSHLRRIDMPTYVCRSIRLDDFEPLERCFPGFFLSGLNRTATFNI